MDKKLAERLKKIKLLALDCDGIMAPLYIDTGVIMDIESAKKYHDRPYQYVVEIARFNHRDGGGIDMIKEAGIKVVVVTKQRSGYVNARCLKLDVPCIKAKDKLEDLVNWMKDNCPGINMKEVCYMGDEVSDVPVLMAVGMPATVADAIKQAKKASAYITKKKGGEGAVREVCDLILKAKGEIPK